MKQRLADARAGLRTVCGKSLPNGAAAPLACAGRWGWGVETLEPRQLLTGLPIITEFMAKNDGFLDDGDGRARDWIEIQNVGDSAIDLAGYRLTDSPANLSRWVFPSVSVDPGEYLVVFASGQDVDRYVDAGGSLHTNFALSANGEYLALVAPDGSVVSQFGTADAPYPMQRANISYGVAQRQTLLDGQSDATFWEPLSGQFDSTWMMPGFDAIAHGFTPGQAAMGFETQPESRNSFSGEFSTALPPQTHAVYARIPFDVSDASQVNRLNLRMKYDNGFVAYLNGVKVAQANTPADAQWFSAASGSLPRDSRALQFEDFDLTGHVSQLVDGANLLAIHGLNSFIDREDMLLVPQLVASVTSPDARVGYMTTPTPGAENVGDGAVFSGVLGETQVDVEAGFYDAPFEVTVSTETPDAQIRYTTDGQPPTAATGNVYTGPIPITTTSILRTAAFKQDHIPSPVATHSYLFLQDVIRQSNDQPGLPTRWEQPGFRFDADYEMDPNIVNDPAYRDEIVEGLKSIRTMSIVMAPEDFLGPDGIYIKTGLHGLASERPVSVEIINPDGSLAIQVDAGLRNHGNRTRDFDVTLKQSFRLVFRSRYGAAKLEYPLFPDSPLDRFDNIILHAGKILDDPQLVRNTFGRDTMRAMGNLEGHATYVHLYLNGLYWGLYNPFERADAQFAAAYLGGREEDYDSILSHTEVIDGDTRRYNEMFGLIRSGITTPEAYEELQRQVDLDSLFDLLLVNQYMAHDEHEMRSIGSRVGDAHFKFFAQDLDEKGMNNVRARPDMAGFLPTGIYDQLRKNPELRMRYADRAHKHLTGDGALTPEAAAQRWQGRYQEIYSAVIGESARWGDTHWRSRFPRQPARRDVELQREGTFLSEKYFPQRSQAVIDQLRRLGIYPDVDAPTWNQYGGPVPADFQLTMSHPGAAGSLLYTLDGTDPRQFGGEVAPQAVIHDGSPVPITGDTVVKARVFFDGQWSALTEGEFVVVGPDSPMHLRITEINYHPHDANPVPGLGEPDVENSRFEFIELTNTGPQTIDVSGVQLTGGAKFTFPAGTFLDSAQQVLVVNDLDAFQARYGTRLNVAGQFDSGTLSDMQARIELRDMAGRKIQSVSYDRQAPWPQRANGAGSSLEVVDPFGAGSDPTNWRASRQFGGSPGSDGLAPDGAVAITEVLAHPSSTEADKIELHNRSSAAVDISNWYLSHSADDYFKYQIPAGTIIPAGGYHVLAATDFGFDLSGSRGDRLWLLAADDHDKPLRFNDQIQFGPSGEAISLGPGPGTDRSWLPLAEPTLGGENSGLLIGDAIISEVHYAPLDPDGDRPLLKADDFEYIELYNRTSSTIDVSRWQISGGVEMTFPAGTTIEAQQSLLVVPFDPADRAKAPIFRVLYDVDPSVLLVGPYSGSLADDGATVRLQRPGRPPTDDPGFTPWLYVDQVAYAAAAPWPVMSADTEASLTRAAADSFGNIPTSWKAHAISPGTVDFVFRLAGDVNEDGRFDQLDLDQLVQSGKYRTRQPATFQEGDWNGDGVFDQFDLVAALQTGAYRGRLAATGSDGQT